MVNKAGLEIKKYDVIIIGGGFSGLTLALGMGNLGLNVACLDKDEPKMQIDKSHDIRTVAISNGSSHVFERVGVWQKMVNRGCLIKKIEIIDDNMVKKLYFDSQEVKKSGFGWIIDNVFMREILQDSVKKHKNIDYIAPFGVEVIENTNELVKITGKNGEFLASTLLVGADGRQSFVRKVQKIRSFGWSYGQTALTCVIEHEKPHDNTAIEHFLPYGPFASVPMCAEKNGVYRSSIVWTLEKAAGTDLLSCSEERFNRALSEQMNRRFGNVRLIGKRQGFPLSFHHAYGYVATRTALIADAAHGIHPIAGQGLNLGMRDIGVLLDVLETALRNGQDIGSDTVLSCYQRKRLLDNTLMCVGTDVLNSVFRIEFTPFKRLRQWGVMAVGHVPPLKRALMRYAMGLSPFDR